MALQSIAASKTARALFACIGLVGHMFRLDVAVEVMTAHKIPVTALLRAFVGSLAIVRVEMAAEVEGTGEGLVAAIKSAGMHPLLDCVRQRPRCFGCRRRRREGGRWRG